MTEQVWIHLNIGTIGIVDGQFIEFKWNGRMEESFFDTLRKDGDGKVRDRKGNIEA